MHNYPLYYFKYLVFTSIFLLSSLSIIAQKNSQIWESLLQNDRNQALELVQKLNTKKDIENLILKKLVLMENGNMQSDPEFVSVITSYENYENYLFSNWMLPYFFGDYLENGFDLKGYDMPHLIDVSKVSNSTVKNGLFYLQALTKRHKREGNDYSNIIDKINAIKEWEYCGVFENLNSSGIEMPYAPEEEVSNNVVFDAQSKGDAKWYLSRNDNEPYNFFTNHTEYGAGVHYAQTFINSPSDQRVHFRLGKKGLIRIWLNDVLIFENDNKYATELDAYTYGINLQKGINRVLVKLATNGEAPNFILRLEDLKGEPLEKYSVSLKDRAYTTSTIESVNPKLIPHSVEEYFKNKLNDSNSDKNLSRFCLFLTYNRTGKIEKAIELLNSWLKDYPKSSFIKSCLAECYTNKGENNTLKKLQSNIKREDPNYYLSSILEYENFDELVKKDIEVYESKLIKIGNATDYSFMKTTSELMIFLRRNDREKIREKLDVLMKDITLPSSIKPTFSEFYSEILNDDNATIKALEAFDKQDYNWEIIQYLAYYYKKQNRIEDAIQLYINSLQMFDADNNVHYKLISLLHDVGQFERSLEYIDGALKNFPNSYLFTKFKGNAYVQLDKKEEAIGFYEKALLRKPSDFELRNKINDLKNNKNPLHEFHIKDAYNYIKKNRNLIERNNYGLNTLLNQTDILGYKNGGGEYKTTLIYEITSQNGIDIFKEYSLGLSGTYLINKSEIVKPNGDTVPADKNGSDLVFDELEINDVIYIDYDASFTRGGRFYNDYILNHSFEGYHPTVKNSYRFLTDDKEVKYILTNGTVDYKTYAKNQFYVHEWVLNNTPGVPISENFMPPFSDVITKLHVSSIESWNEIAVWYSDIVRKQLIFDKTLEIAFNTIFPDGYISLSETERAKKIYYYITNNLNYSHVSFRQGGFVPQKPSKTIKTKLGDCKDFSSLFLVLAKKAKLDTKMVLILTSDYGKNELLLPSSDFNHCIVNVKMDGVEHYLELTDKYLPFKSLPMSLRNAAALEIPFDSSKNFTSKLIYLKDSPREKAKFKSSYVMNIRDDISNIDLTSEITGHLASYYINIFNTEKDKLLEESILQEIANRSSESIKLINIESFNHNKDEGKINFKTKLTTDLKVNTIEDLFTFKIPYFLNPYNNAIIQDERRSYPIDYKQYENSDSYNESIHIKLEKNKEIIDLPKDAVYKFKEHSFSIKYLLLEPNELKIEILASSKPDMISINEYSEFKSYVEKVLDTRETIIKFKSTAKTD